MTAHVAEATEARGRVILRFSCWAPNDVAIEAAMLVAHAYNSEVEVLLVEDSQRYDFAGFPFAREFSPRGGEARTVSPRAVRAETQAAFSIARKRVAAAASELEVPVREHVVRDDPVQALVSACARRGPWNMIAIAETFDRAARFSLDEIFDTVSGTTGVIIVGPVAQRRPKAPARNAMQRPKSGPVVLAVEDTGRLQGMLRTGRYIAAELEAEIVIVLIAGTDDELARMEAEVRLALADQVGVRIARTCAAYDDHAAVAEVIRRQRSGFLIAQFGGVTVPRHSSLRPLTGALQCPLLLVR